MYAIKQPKSETMHPQEAQVFDALAHYCFEPADTRDQDFVPTGVLYQTYRDHVWRVYGRSAETLNLTQFGVALRRAFGIGPERKTRRTYQGRNVMGYFHVRGPGSIITHKGRGNPNFGHAAATATTPPADDFAARLAASRAAAAAASEGSEAGE